jgi:predicted GNAT family acetyltransferase
MRSVRRQLGKLGKDNLLVLDGFEQFSPLERSLVIWWTRWRKCGLLVTSHNQVRLPVLLRTDITSNLARKIMEACWCSAGQSGQLPDYLDKINLEALLRKHSGNLRESLMELYDLVQRHEPINTLEETK